MTTREWPHADLHLCLHLYLHVARCALLALAMVAPACGDMRDARVPVPAAARVRATVPLYDSRPRVLLNVHVDAAGDAGATCPVELASIVQREPGARPSSAASNVDAPIHVECAVRMSADAATRYDVDIVASHDGLPKFALQGALHDAAALPVRLRLTPPAGPQLQAICDASVVSIEPGAVAFSLVDCRASSAGLDLPGCAVRVVAAFDGCAR